MILSSVRTKQPGFLRSQPRMNVALTRCRKGMVVVTDKSFLQGAGRNTLLGQLCSTWSSHRDACWIDSKAMLNNSGALPGLPAPAPSRPTLNAMHSHNLSGRTTIPAARNPPPSQTQTQTRTHQDQVPLSARATLSPGLVRSLMIEHQRQTAAAALEATQFIMSLSNSNYQRRGVGGGAWRSAATPVVRRDLDDDEFPSLRPLVAALDPIQLPSWQRSGRGRR